MIERLRPTIDTGPGLTKQSFKDECDVNFIMNRWQRTGELPDDMVGKMPPSYGDFTNASDYMSACNQVIAARESFAQLPAFLRDRFGNEPANLLRFLANPDNQDEAVKLGLSDPPPDPPAAPPEPDLPPAIDPSITPPLPVISGGE